MKRIGILIVSALMVVAAVMMPSQGALAASNSISVNPRKNFTIKPGEKVSDTLFISNADQKNPLDASIAVIDFDAQDQTGAPALQLHESHPTPWSLKPYLSIPSEYKLDPGQSANVPFTISIPKNLGAGTYYSAVRVAAGGNTSNKNVSLAGAAVSLFFVTVPGEANSNLQLTHFGTFTPTADGSSGVFDSFYSATAPKYVAYILKNLGNIAEQPSGSIVIDDIFGNQTKVFQDANPLKNLVLINQTRRVQLCLNEKSETKKDSQGLPVTTTQCNNFKFLPGRYTAHLDLLYGNSGGSQKELKADSTFWYLPPWFIIAVFVVLLVIAGVIWLGVTAIKNKRSGKYRTRH